MAIKKEGHYEQSKRDPDSDRLPKRWARTGAEINAWKITRLPTAMDTRAAANAIFWLSLSGMFIVQAIMRRAANSRLELKNG
jgi:hypothetical protein